MFVLSQQNSIANHFLADLRDINQQTDRLRFRTNLERLGQILAFEISKSMDYEGSSVTTPLADTTVNKIIDQPIIISVMRAAMPFYQGVLSYFDQADSGFIGAYRKEESNNNEVEIEFNYLAAPSIENKEIILVDPMLATGKSLIKSIEQLHKNGTPKKVHIAAVIAAPEGIKHLEENLKSPYQLWLGAVDEKLNEKAYIVPGLGDAGDLCFGPKL
ncbi:uracil phosphoribosyltransferase [Echinicola sp. CAU 1574]|uniref:Uracil phosphoribosyltransferase n=1 Tax=Echinicola arenosa TaxID=2774144 RepID=A0ABR9AHV5_9BACT|nr:uracil phosphoribosyltransferase [Echinicola arenosa]MBD8488305.1 uracil phosphoribosyltransferase [Echinicola arenosa]